MKINEIPSPTFAVNKQGRVSVFLPAFEGEPDNPHFSYKTDSSILFNRTAEEACILSGLSEDVMGLLKESQKCLIIEVDLEKAAVSLETEKNDIEESFHRLYEVTVDMKKK